MTSWFYNAALLAQAGRAAELSRNFRGSRARFGFGDVLIVVGIFIAVGALVWVLSQFLSRQDRTGRYNQPKRLFRQLCQAHDLDRASRLLLQRLARHQGLDDPARIFLEPERFNPVNVGRDLRDQQPRLDVLRGTLFSA